ncbi:hypothetical protein KY290_017415 [Solanum tuberosum]|uniref:Uncharacterized protein n=1 Tax=Solanum tuberosum TaxID=4113 RepID=A0ABQ7VB78_SOLTU|nr:hypothetical protein KY290_017415 [Solanum tuberosum]
MESQTIDKDENDKEERNSSGAKYSREDDEDGRIKEIVRNASEEIDEHKEIPDLQELTREEQQARKEGEKDEEIDDNIDKVAREGDLSPRQISNLKSGVKKGKTTQPSLPLQDKTRISKDFPDNVSQ